MVCGDPDGWIGALWVLDEEINLFVGVRICLAGQGGLVWNHWRWFLMLWYWASSRDCVWHYVAIFGAILSFLCSSSVQIAVTVLWTKRNC